MTKGIKELADVRCSGVAMTKTRAAARWLVNGLPGQGRLLKRWYRAARLKRELVMSRLRSQLGGRHVNPFAIFWIDPDRIEHHTKKTNTSKDWEDWVFPGNAGITQPVAGGDWDRSDLRVVDMRVVRAIDDRINRGFGWEQSDFYQVAVSEIEDGRELWGCRSRSQFEARCNRIDQLIDSIGTNGYLTRDDLVQRNFRQPGGTGFDEILVNIGRDGRCLFQDGRHRLAIARALKLPAIPVQVFVRHQQWHEFRCLLERMAQSAGGASNAGVLYQPAMHFDLQDVPAEHASEDRWAAMRPHLGDPGAALDIGCNLGYFCHMLEQNGFSCTGVEYEADIAFAAQRIAVAEGRRFQVLNGDVLDPAIFERAGQRRFEVVVALNIFHHFIKTESGHERLRAMLGRLDCQCMFFEPHMPDDPQMHHSFWNPSPGEFVKAVMQWGQLGQAEHIHSAADGRQVYCLRK